MKPTKVPVLYQRPKKMKRFQVSTACTNCAVAHLSCSAEKPCPRCVSKGLECIETPRKKRLPKRKSRAGAAQASANGEVREGSSGNEDDSQGSGNGSKRSRDDNDQTDDFRKSKRPNLTSLQITPNDPLSMLQWNPNSVSYEGDRSKHPASSTVTSPIASNGHPESNEALEALMFLGNTNSQQKRPPSDSNQLSVANSSLPAFGNSFQHHPQQHSPYTSTLPLTTPSFPSAMTYPPQLIPLFPQTSTVNPMDQFFQQQSMLIPLNWRFQGQQIPMALFVPVNGTFQDAYSMILGQLLNGRLLIHGEQISISIYLGGNQFALSLTSHGPLPLILLGFNDPSALLDVNKAQ